MGVHDPASFPLPAAPGSGATITLFDTLGKGLLRDRKAVVNIRTSHISAASGLEFQATWDNGLTWNDIVAYTVPALTAGVPFSIYEVPLAYPRARCIYTNSANVLTTWQGNFELIDAAGAAA